MVFDQFGQSSRLRLDKRMDRLPLKWGTFCSLFLVIVLVAYAGYKVSILDGKKRVDILTSVSKDHFDEKYTFGGDQGLNFAVAVIDSFNKESFQPIDPSYGRISFVKASFGMNDEGDFQRLGFEELESHKCSLEELGFEGTDSKFFPVNRQQKQAVQA